jgi:hypothetical protein
MNANELADKLDNFYSYVNEPYLLVKTSTMLRQQAQEIADLKIANQDLKYQLIQKSGEQVLNDFKELSDEVIHHVALQCWDYPIEEYPVFNQYKFARAILKKATEK